MRHKTNDKYISNCSWTMWEENECTCQQVCFMTGLSLRFNNNTLTHMAIFLHFHFFRTLKPVVTFPTLHSMSVSHTHVYTHADTQVRLATANLLSSHKFDCLNRTKFTLSTTTEVVFLPMTKRQGEKETNKKEIQA